MRRYVFSFAMLAIASCLPVAAYAGEQQDKKIAEQVVQRLQKEKASGRLKGFSIDLQVENGTLWLSGRVPSAEQQAAALDVARRVPGVKQVVNDLSVAPAPATAKAVPSRLVANTKAAAAPTGSGVEVAAAVAPAAQPQALPQPVNAAPVAAQPGYAGGQPMYASPRPMYPGQQPISAGGQRPVAFAPAYSVAMANATFPGHHHHHGGGMPMPAQGGYCPPGAMGMGGGPAAMAAGPAARYDSPQMPGYAWPSYASHPNYAAVTYPKQYSASAWPYIGPFYPYPQVPLGWRKVELEWDDGWWFLDFKDCGR
jgi:hypothetical protein